MKYSWHILSGEYPPSPGGVSDYTRIVAAGLAARGEHVEVWAPARSGALVADPGVRLRPLPEPFGLGALALLERELRRDRSPKRLFVQYVPHAFGFKGMNAPFCAWLAARRRERVWVMFHEVAYPFGRRQPLRHNLLATVTRGMASLAARRADEALVSTLAWADLLRRLGRSDPAHWVPIPSMLPSSVPPERVEAARAAVASSRSDLLLGHFGTFGGLIADMLAPVLTRVLTQGVAGGGARRALLLGRGSARFAATLGRAHPALRELLTARDDLAPEAAAAHLAACDLVVQPFPDGATTRRTSLMAGLALGRPVVTNDGPLCEPIFRRGGVCLAGGRTEELVSAVEYLLGSAERRESLGASARALYEERFSVERTLTTLTALARAEETGRGSQAFASGGPRCDYSS